MEWEGVIQGVIATRARILSDSLFKREEARYSGEPFKKCSLSLLLPQTLPYTHPPLSLSRSLPVSNRDLSRGRGGRTLGACAGSERVLSPGPVMWGSRWLGGAPLAAGLPTTRRRPLGARGGGAGGDGGV